MTLLHQDKVLTLLWLSVFLLAIACQQPDTQNERPNIIFIMADDLGKEWVSGYGAEGIQTPNIDKLIDQGIRFNNVYSMPQCTPTRLTILTGEYPYEHGWVNHWDVPRWGGGAHFDEKLNPTFTTKIKEAGYKTCIAGKWQIDDFRIEPDALTKIGFDHFCMWTGGEGGNPKSDERYADPYIFTEEGSKIMKGSFGPDVFTNFIIDFIEQERDQPFFVYYPMVLPHTPFINTPISNAGDKLGKHIAMIEYVDMLTGRIIDALDKSGKADNTIVIWTSDNGTTGKITGVLNGEKVKGGKSHSVQSGCNIPFVVRWPKVIESARESNALIDFTDLFPTFLDIANVDYKNKIGSSIYDLLKDPSISTKRDWVMSMGGGNHAALTDKGVENQYRFRDRVIMDEDYKLYVNSNRQAVKLFDLTSDPYEKNNLIDKLGIEDRRNRVDKLMKIILDQPERDNDPKYTPNPKQSWDVAISQNSQKWKL